MKSSAQSRKGMLGIGAALIGMGMFAVGCVAGEQPPTAARKLDLTVLPTNDRTVRVSVAGARQVAGDVLVRVRVVRQGVNGLHRARSVRVALVNAQGQVEHRAMQRLSRAALNRRGAGYQWLTLSLPHEMSASDTLLLSLDSAPAS